jgi:Fic family protein
MPASTPNPPESPSDSGDLTYFIKYNLDCVKKALEETLKYLAREQKEKFQALKIITESGNLT